MGVKYKKLLIILSLIISFFVSFFQVKIAKADELSDNIQGQLDELDFSGLEDYLANINDNSTDESFIEFINKIIKGEYSVNFSSTFDFIVNAFFSEIKFLGPIFLGVIFLAMLNKVISSVKGVKFKEEIERITSYIFLMAVSLLLVGGFKSIFKNAQNNIKNLSKLSDIMSPIILTLMTTSGATVSASLYKPAVSFFSNGIVNVILYAVLPLIALSVVFYVISKFSINFKLIKFAELFNSCIKWIIGLSITVFSLFLSVQGLGAGMHDGISLKAIKYAISNSIPVVGGFLKDGFDLMVAGSVLIKNAVGIGGVFLILHTILSPLILMIAFSLGLKLVSAVTGAAFDLNISDLCDNVSKATTYLISSLLIVGFMIFITVLLMIISANAFI